MFLWVARAMPSKSRSRALAQDRLPQGGIPTHIGAGASTLQGSTEVPVRSQRPSSASSGWNLNARGGAQHFPALPYS